MLVLQYRLSYFIPNSMLIVNYLLYLIDQIAYIMVLNKKIFLLFAAGWLGISGYFTDPALQDNQAQITLHLVSDNVVGTIGGLQTKSHFDPEQLHESFIRAKVQVASLKTGNMARDLRLFSKKFLGKKKYPEIAFKSTRIVQDHTGYLVVGNLTIKDISKSTVLDTRLIQDTIFAVTSVNLMDFGIQVNEKRFENKVDVYIRIPLNASPPQD